MPVIFIALSISSVSAFPVVAESITRHLGLSSEGVRDWWVLPSEPDCCADEGLCVLRSVFMQSFVLMGLKVQGKSPCLISRRKVLPVMSVISGSTVVCREGLINDAGICTVDTPHTFSERQ